MANATNSTPATLQDWVKRLDSVILPVPLASHDRVSRALNNSRSSLREIADLIQGSPALALSVIREANRHVSSSLTEPCENLEVAISRLGLKRTAQLLARLPAVPQNEIPPALRKLQMISQHASQQANGFFASRLARLWQDIHWGSLLFLAPLWPLALSDPQRLEDWERRVIHNGEAAHKVEKELFGVHLLELCQTLVELWRLPYWVAQGYRLLISEQRELAKVLLIARDADHPLRQQNRLDDDPTLRRWLNQPANTVLLANGLALSAQCSWVSPHTLRWQYLTSLYLQIPMDDVQQQQHQQAAQSARNHAMPDIWHPAEALLWPWGSADAQRDRSPAGPTAEDLAQWRKHCAQLLTEPSPFSNALHLTTCARDALAACGLRRAVLLMADRSHSQLRAHQTLGLGQDAAALNLVVSQSSILQRLLAQPAQLRLTPANHGQFSAHLPATLRSLFSGQHLLLRSLAINGKVLMVLVADQGGGDFSDITVQAFGKTAQCIEKALHSFSHRGQ